MLTYPRTNSRFLPSDMIPRDQADRLARRARIASTPKARGVRDRAGRAAAGPRDQRREGHRPPRDHPDQLRAQARQALRRRPPHLRHGRAALPGRLPSRRGVREHAAGDDGRRAHLPHPRPGAAGGRLARRLRRDRGRAAAPTTTRATTSSCRSSSRARTSRCCEVASEEKITQPPRRYSDASLLGAMETAGKLVDDDELREAMKDSGIGTPATRAAIIERLIDVGYVERDGRSLVVHREGPRRHPAAGRPRADLAVADRRLGAPAVADRGGRRGARERFMADIAAVRRRDGHDPGREAQGGPDPAGQPRPLPGLRPRHRREPQGLLLLGPRGPGLRLRHLEVQGRQDPAAGGRPRADLQGPHREGRHRLQGPLRPLLPRQARADADRGGPLARRVRRALGPRRRQAARGRGPGPPPPPRRRRVGTVRSGLSHKRV